MSMRKFFTATSVAVGRRRMLIGAAALTGSLALSPFAFAQTSQAIPVVASFSILGDMVKQVGGEAVTVTNIVSPEADAHTFEPRPSDAKALVDAKAVFVNGLEFEMWLPRLVESAGYKGPQFVATKGIEPLKFDEEAHGHHHDHDHDHDHAHAGHDHHHGEFDPHMWQSLDKAVFYVENIRDGLIEIAPESEALFRANADAYLAQIAELNQEVKAAFNAIPNEGRKVITSHDAFAYLGHDYDIEFIALLGVSNQAEPSAKEIADVVKRARDEQISAIFVENIVSPKLVEQVARETGAKVGGVLYSDALAPAPHDADTYLGMIRWNTGKIIDALGR